MLDELGDILVEPFLVYEKKNKVLPQRIFVYRDGVPEAPGVVLDVVATNIIFRSFRANSTRWWKSR
jgi:hypothetical protein